MERQILAWLRATFRPRPPLLIGIGDDAAVLRPSGEGLVLTSDAVVDGVHFETARHDWSGIGHKSIAVNFSDLAAMGATPVCVLVTLILPARTTLSDVQRLYAGIEPLCARWGASIAGGDTNFYSGPLAIAVTAVGELPREESAWRLDRAQAGDAILVSGSFGGSILGKHLNFEPRCDLAQALAGRFPVHAATDVSDGLALNLNAILTASGCGAELDLNSVPIAPAARELAEREPASGSAVEHALYDGEDFELILTVGSNAAEEILADQALARNLTRIGRVTAERGLWAVPEDGSRYLLPIRGYSHGPAANLS
jgi:thiamine-monophosphate kinase